MDGAAMIPPAGFLDDALAFAERQWPVFPLRPGDKVPLIAKAAGGNGVHDATTDPDQIRAWWEKHPSANIGLAAGSTFWTLDVDYKGWPDVNPDATYPDGADTLTALQARFGRLPPTVKQYTGGLGWQWFFRPDPRIRNGVRVPPGLDPRSPGGYVVAPPSLHPSGRHYRWIAGPDEAELALAPGWLVRLLEPVELPQPVAPAPRPIRGANSDRYGEAALERAVERIGSAPPGEQCDVLDRQAYGIGRLIAGGVIPRDLARVELVTAGLRMQSQGGRRPWTGREVAWRVDRALASGARSPRTPEVGS